MGQNTCVEKKMKKKMNIEFSLVWLDEQFPTSLSLVDTFVFGLCVCVCVEQNSDTRVDLYHYYNKGTNKWHIFKGQTALCAQWNVHRGSM